MDDLSKFNFESESYGCQVIDDIAVVKFKICAFDVFAMIDEANKILALYDEIERNNKIKALLFEYGQDCLSESVYYKFLNNKINNSPDSGSQKKIRLSDKRFIRARNILIRTIIRAIEYEKLLVVALKGEVVTPFFGASLASDFRFVTKNMHFSLTHTKYGIYPGGALPFFLTQFVGRNKATELLFQGGDISAEEALDMGLVTDILPSDDFGVRCIEEIQKRSQLDLSVIRKTKRLINYNKNALIEYLETESSFTER